MGMTLIKRSLYTDFPVWLKSREPIIDDCPIIVYTPRKVASTTITQTLRSNGLTVHKQHSLNEISNRLIQDKLYVINKKPLHWMIDGLIFKKRLNNWSINNKRINTEKKCKVITLIKDPISVGLSDLFMNLFEFYPDEALARKLDNIDNLINFYSEIYLNKQWGKDADFKAFLKALTEFPIHWLETELKYTFDIDVLSSAFDKQHGYTIYSGKKADVLLLRAEDVNTYGAEALSQFFNLEITKLNPSNVTKEKPYGKLYQQLIKQFQLPEEVLIDIYKKTNMDHFYAENEINDLILKWRK